MRFRTSSGLSIRYRSAGVGRTVLLMHPIGVRAEFWDDVIALLSREMRLISVDTRGHGESDVPSKPFGLGDCADDFIELLAAVGQGPTVVAGCSMGGMIAQAIAGKRPDLVAGVVAANTVHRRPPQSIPVYEKRAEDALKGMDVNLKTTLSRWFDYQACVENPEAVAFCRRCLLDADPVVHAWSWLAIRDLNVADALKASNVPVLALAGARDQATPVAGVKAIAEELPRATYQEVDAGHMSGLEAPRLFADILRAFVDTVSPRR
jgi:pimeloyl-ACP methyl ester carboxylesterase